MGIGAILSRYAGPHEAPRLSPCFLACFAAFHRPVAGQGPRLVVLNKEDATLVTVDPATGKVAGTVPTGEAPHEVAVSADGRPAFVGNYGGADAGQHHLGDRSRRR